MLEQMRVVAEYQVRTTPLANERLGERVTGNEGTRWRRLPVERMDKAKEMPISEKKRLEEDE